MVRSRPPSTPFPIGRSGRLAQVLVAVLLGLLGGIATAQGPAQGKLEAELFTRVEGDSVEAALELRLAPTWHLYHTELGHPEAVGQPTKLTLGGDGITWGEAVWPEPHRYDQSSFDPGVFILGHEGTVVVRATGTLAEGATAADASASIEGQVCDPSVCLPVRGLTVTTSGEGPDRLFPAQAETGGSESGGSEAAASAEPVPTADAIAGGHADATLYTRVDGDEVLAALEIGMEFGWHLYGNELGHPEAVGEPTVVTLEGEGVTWGPVHYPEPHPLDQGFQGSDGSEVWINAYDGVVVLHARGTLAEGADGGGLWGVVEGQTCTDQICVNYEETFVSQGEGPDELFAVFEEEGVVLGPEAGAGGSEVVATGAAGSGGAAGGAKQPLGAFLLLCIGGGLFTLLMPCTYPMIPITISFFTKQAEARNGKVLPLSLAYGAGIVLIFTVIGAVVGPPIVAFAQHWITNLVIGLAFLYFALVLFGIVDLQPPRWLMKLAGSAQGKGGLSGVFLMGVTLVVTSFTCTAPIVGAILGAGVKGGDLGRVLIGMAVFGLTMAIPFVVLSLLPGRLASIPKAGQWMNTLKFFLGFVEVAAAMKFFSNVDVAVNEGAKWLPYEPFLWIWVAIFVLAALYLFGIVRFKGPKVRVGPVRIVGGLLTLLFAGYIGFAAWRQFPTDKIMAALAPPVELEPTWTLLADDYDAARQLALEEDKLLLVNFTGHT